MNKEMIDNFLNSFLYFYQKFGDDSKIFFERLFHEAQNIKNNHNAEDDFVKIFEEELKNIVEKEDKKNIETTKDILKDTPTNENQPNEAQNKESLKTFVLPMNWENFQFNMDSLTKEVLKNHVQDLKKLNLYKQENLLGTPIGVYATDNLFSEEKIKEYQKQYAKSYLEKLSQKIDMDLKFLDFNSKNDIILQSQSNLSQEDFMNLIQNIQKQYGQDMLTPKNLNWEFDIGEIKTFHKDSIDFINVFENEIKDLENSKHQTQTIEENPLKIPTLNKKQDLVKPQYSSLLDFFEKKRIENENMAISKDEFKKDFLNYCKTNMNEIEMKTLVNLYNKEPSKLTKEHKDMLKKGMRYNLINHNLLNKDLEISIKNTLNIPLSKDDKLVIQKNEVQSIQNQVKAINPLEKIQNPKTQMSRKR